ncbi:MAG TPA: WXG100 family type VII secretion target [Ktedonobacterales bacterium]
MTIQLDPERVRTIANSCRNSGDAIEQQAQTMNSQMQQLQEALAGVPQVGLEDRFNEWSQLFRKLSESLHESHTFLNSIADRIDRLVTDLR